MAPPAVIELIVRPCMLIVEFKEAVIRAVRIHIRTLFIPRLILIDPFPVQPLVKGSAVVEDTVENDLHPPSVDLPTERRKKLVGGFQICGICHTFNILCRMSVILVVPA